MNEHQPLWNWFLNFRRRLEKLNPEAIAEEFTERLHKIDSRLSAEIGQGDDGFEVIVSANLDATRFPLVRELVAVAPSVPGWSFTALKPARGFDFVLSTDAGEVNASALRFDPMRAEHHPSLLGIHVYLPGLPPELRDDNDVVDMVWLIVETGVGEEATARIYTIKVSPFTEERREALPISDLGQYVRWYFSRGPGNPD